MTAPFDDRAFRLLHETSGIGYWRIDLEGRTRSTNPAMRMMLELSSQADLDGKTYHEFFTAESLEVMREEHRKRHAGIASTYDVEIVGLRGTHRHVVLSGVPDVNEAGELIGLFGSFTDVTEVKRAEAALRSSEKKLRSLFAASVDAIGVSRNGVHLLVNPGVRMRARA